MTDEKKLSKSQIIEKELAKQTVTVTLYAERATLDKNGNAKNVVFALAGAMDKVKATKATFPLAMVYGDANVHEIGDLVEVTIRKLPKAAE